MIINNMESKILFVFVFLFGICIASFINVVIYRLPLKISVVKGRSFCPHCHHQLQALDLIPIFSFVFLKGKCRYCHKSIPMRDWILEIFGGIIAMVCFHHYGMSWMTLLSFCLSMVFIAISFIDLETMEIYDGLIIVCLIIALLISLITNIHLMERIVGFFIVSLPMYLMNLFYKECFGGGDIKLISVCGMMLGWRNLIIAMMIAVILASLYSFCLLLMHKVERNSYIAFGPFICCGVFMSLLYGELILSLYWYMYF